MNVLIIVDHHNKALNQATLNVIAAGLCLAESVDALVIGNDCVEVAEDVATVKGVNQVLLADHQLYQHHLPENLSKLIAEQAHDYDSILAPANTFGKNLLPRVSALLDVEQVSNVIEIISETVFKRTIYAENIIQTVDNGEAKKVLTIRTTAFKSSSEKQEAAEIIKLNSVIENSLSTFVSLSKTESQRPELTTAKVVVSGGRGFQNADNFKLLEQLADKFNAAIGATRAAVDAGFVANDCQVGQTGKIVAPELYIAIGISGAIQHLAGIKDSQFIVAINKDPDAPIFQIADLGLVGDLFEILPALEKMLDEQCLVNS